MIGKDDPFHPDNLRLPPQESAPNLVKAILQKAAELRAEADKLSRLALQLDALAEGLGNISDFALRTSRPGEEGSCPYIGDGSAAALGLLSLLRAVKPRM